MHGSRLRYPCNYQNSEIIRNKKSSSDISWTLFHLTATVWISSVTHDSRADEFYINHCEHPWLNTPADVEEDEDIDKAGPHIVEAFRKGLAWPTSTESHDNQRLPLL